MSTHDALDTTSATLREASAGTEAERADSRVADDLHAAPRGYSPPRLRDVRPDEVQAVSEGNLPARSIARDGTYRRLLAIADLIAAATAFAVAIPFAGDDTVGIWTVIAVLMVVPVCKLAGLYDRDEHLLHKRTLDEAPALFFVASLYTLLAFLAGEAIVEGTFGREQAAVLWGLLFLAMLLARVCARHVAARLTKEERCVILGNAQAAHWLSSKLARCEGARVNVVGRVPLSNDDASVNGMPVLGSFDSLASLLVEHEIDRALIAPGWEDSHLRMLDVVRIVKRLGVRASVLPRLFEVVGSAYEIDEVEGATLLGVRRHGLTRSSWFIKRSFDLVVGSLLLVLLAPLMALISLAVKLDSRGPVFFRQRRVGREDQVFEIFKFRTMVDGAHAQREDLAHRNEAGGGLFKIEDDPRITRVGRFLRRTSLDELPQLFNVLSADMSLVGPRPLVLDEDRLIEGHQRHRLLVPPGVTGLWQIFGSARIPLNEMVKIDYLYGANWSLWMDIKILLRTVPVAVGRRGL
jgi:exopolysaccharide biosynthesis polyprenyl glycosylphosphotransferase